MTKTNNKEKYLLDSILYKAPTISDPKDYISSIESSGLPKLDYIMNKYRASSIEYVVENPPPKLFVSNEKDKKQNYINTINNNNYKPKESNTYNINNSPPIQTKPRSKSCPPLKDLPCTNCKKTLPIDQLDSCERCGCGYYCSEDCQYANWPIHKKKCKNLGMVIKMKRNYSF